MEEVEEVVSGAGLVEIRLKLSGSVGESDGAKRGGVDNERSRRCDLEGQDLEVGFAVETEETISGERCERLLVLVKLEEAGDFNGGSPALGCEVDVVHRKKED